MSGITVPLEPPAPKAAFHLADEATWGDLRTFVQRARRVDPGGAIYLASSAQRPVLAAWVAIFDAAANLVVAMRPFRLRQSVAVDVAVYLSAVADRLARPTAIAGNVLSVPPVRAQAKWAKRLPGTSGWQPLAPVAVTELRDAAQSGAAELARLTPTDAGQPVVTALRSQIWFATTASAVPAGAAFALDVMGFLPPTGEVPRFVAPPTDGAVWQRLSAGGGHVLARTEAP